MICTEVFSTNFLHEIWHYNISHEKCLVLCAKPRKLCCRSNTVAGYLNR